MQLDKGKPRERRIRSSDRLLLNERAAHSTMFEQFNSPAQITTAQQ